MDETPVSANPVPSEIVHAARTGDAATVQRWLADGGDPNQDLHQSAYFLEDFRLVLVAASHGETAVVRLLLEHGADINYAFSYADGDVYDEYGNEMTALVLASGHDLDLIRLLLDNGPEEVRICVEALSIPRLVRMLLAAGADINARSCQNETPETWLRQKNVDSENEEEHDLFMGRTESLRIIEGTRLAGSFKNFVLLPFKELLRLRSLLARKRANIGPATPEVVARLFGGRTDDATRPARRRSRPLPPRTAGVPDPAFWLVMEYWRLGDWRRGGGPE